MTVIITSNLIGTHHAIVMTSSTLSSSSTIVSISNIPRICHRDFQQYHGLAKAIWTGGDAGHYMKVMNKNKNIQLLTHHAELNIESLILFLEGAVVIGDGREMFLIQNHTRRPFGDYDTFLSFNVPNHRIRHVRDHVLNQIPLGTTLPSVLGPPPTELPTPPPSKSASASVTASSSSSSSSNSNHSSSLDICSFLVDVKNQIDKEAYNCFGDDYAGTRDDFLNDQWKKYLGSDKTVMVYPMCLRSFQLGNTLGYFFNDVACSDASGSHFISVSKHFDIQESSQSHKNTSQLASNPYSFFQYLPDLIIHPQPMKPNEAKQLMRSECDCLQYCWENSKAPWISRTSLLSYYLLHAINGYLKDMILSVHPHLSYQEMSLLTSIRIRPNISSPSSHQVHYYDSSATGKLVLSKLVEKHLTTQLNNETDMIILPSKGALLSSVSASSSVSISSSLNISHISSLLERSQHKEDSNYVNEAISFHLPLIPKATIQYRCGDNIGFGKTRYGLLPFRVFKHILQSNDIKPYDLIFLIADSPTRSAQHVYSSRCSTILEHLVNYLHKHFPSAMIVMKRGGDMFLDYARLAYSDVTICSASTFCIWPAVSKPQGHAYYPLTPLIAKAETNMTAPKFSDSFHWIDEVSMVKEFKNFRPWYNLLDVLEQEE